MGLFGDDESDTEEVDPPKLEEAQVDDAPQPSDSAADSESEDGPSGAKGEDPQPDQAADEGQADEADEEASGDPGDSGDEDIDVEDALKDLSARMSVLSSNLEGVQESRSDLENKIQDVEKRMSRLGSLAEAVSSEYNPFISENAPSEPSWKPQPEDPEAGQAPSGSASGAEDPEGSPSEPGQAPAGASPDDPADPTTPAEGTDPTPGSGPDGPTLPGESPVQPGALEAAEAARTAAESAPEQRSADQGQRSANPEPDRDPEPADAPTNGHPSGLDPASLDPSDLDPSGGSAGGLAQEDPPYEGPDELEANLLLLEWVGMMLDRVGRVGLMDLLDYYQNLGWLDRDTKERATRVAVGVDAPDTVEGHWRGDLDLHRKSLVAIQRLQGEEIPAARIDELELDLRRLFRE